MEVGQPSGDSHDSCSCRVTTTSSRRVAVMMFEGLHGLATDGIAGPRGVERCCFTATSSHQMDPNPWDWVYVQKTPEPETVYVWSNGKMVFQTPANTGATGFTTPDGSFPVYLHWAIGRDAGHQPGRFAVRRQGRACGSATSTKVTPSMRSFVVATARRRVSVASRCRRRLHRRSGP